MKEIIATGATIEEAVENGAVQLGINKSLVEYEVLEQPKGGLLSIFSKPAKVRVFFDDTIEEDDDDDFNFELVQDDDDSAYVEEAEAEESADEDMGEDNADDDITEEADRESEPAKAAGESENYAEATQVAVDYLTEIISLMGVRDLDITAESDGERTILNINGNDDDLGVVIGHRGDTLTALQYLVSLAANNCCKGYFKVSLNVKNFREKRERTLETVASKTSYKAIKLQKNIALEPMSPYERSIIHTAVQGIEGVTSWSVGENEKRHVVIGPIGLDEGGEGMPVKYAKVNTRSPRGGYGRSSYGSRGGYQNRGGHGGYGNRNGYNNRRGSGYRNDRDDRGYRENRRDRYNKYDNRYNNENRAPAAPKTDYESAFTYGKIEVRSDNDAE